jgi:WhiB family redox-sensing transcriptional regulator
MSTIRWEDALCRQSDPDAWFPEQAGDNAHRAKAVCRICPLRVACLRYALDTREPHGIYGGFSVRQRTGMQPELAAEYIALDKERDRIREKAKRFPIVVDQELRDAHARFFQGATDAATLAGEKEYQAQRHLARKKRGLAA